MAFFISGLLGAPGLVTSPSSRIVIDRHVHKTGGTTVRKIFQNAAAQGECMYWGYGVQTSDLSKVVEALLYDNATVRGTQLCVEQHMANDVLKEHEMLQGLRKRASVYQMTRVREPLSYYLSYFKWAIVGNKLAEQGRGDAGLAQYFLEWAPTNLQTNLLLYPLSSPPVEMGLDRNASTGDFRVLQGLSEADYDAAVAMLDQYELVGTTERFEDFAAVVALETGLSIHYQHEVPEQRFLPVRRCPARPTLALRDDAPQPCLQARPAATKPHFTLGQAPHAALPTHKQPAHVCASCTEQEGHEFVTDEQLCPDMAKCRAHVARLTPYDQRLYERYSSRFEERLKAFSDGNGTATGGNDTLSARVAALAPVAVPTSAEVRARTGKEVEEWFGGAPPDAKCAWRHQPTAPEYSVSEPCGRVSTAVGRIVQTVVSGGKTVDASYGEPACCLKFGEVCDDACQALRALAMECDEACQRAKTMVAEGEAAMGASMSAAQRQALARVALLAERRHGSRPGASASAAKQSVALLASNDAFQPTAAAAAAQQQQQQQQRGGSGLLEPQLLDLEEASDSGNGDGLWRVVSPARAAELRAVRPSSLWSPRR